MAKDDKQKMLPGGGVAHSPGRSRSNFSFEKDVMFANSGPTGRTVKPGTGLTTPYYGNKATGRRTPMPSPTSANVGPGMTAPSPRAAGAEDMGSFNTFRVTDPMMAGKLVDEGRRNASLPTSQGSPAGKVVPGDPAHATTDLVAGEDRLQSPAYIRYLKQQNVDRLPEGVNFNSETGFYTNTGGSYGSGKTPLTATYDRAGEAALVQQRRNEASAFIEGGRGDRREANLRRRANARLSGDMGIVDFVTAAANRKNARSELDQLISEKGKDRRALLTAETSMRNTDATQAGALQRSLISEQGDTQRAEAAQRATAALEQYKQGQSNFRTTLKELASTDRKQMEINSKKFLAEFKSNDEFLTRSAEELGMTEVGLKNIIAQGVIPVLNQERAESGQPPLSADNIANLPPTELVSAVAAAAQFDRRVASSQDWFGDPAVSPQEALDLATTNAYSVRLPRGKDKSGQTR